MTRPGAPAAALMSSNTAVAAAAYRRGLETGNQRRPLDGDLRDRGKRF
jgi:hypothetical protein